MNKAERERVRTLARRRNYLRQVLKRDERAPDHSWLAAEAGALTWALKVINEHTKESR